MLRLHRDSSRSYPGRDLPDVGSYRTTALCMATCRVIGQEESAEAIVGMEAAILDGMVVGNEPGE